MGLGLGIFLMAVGLILSLGVRDRLADFDLSAIGWVLTGVGIVAIALSLIVAAMRSRRTRTEIIDDGYGPRRREVVDPGEEYDGI